MEREGRDKPVCVAESVARRYLRDPDGRRAARWRPIEEAIDEGTAGR